MEILLHFLSFLNWKVFKKSKIAQSYYYDPPSTGMNLQSPQSESTPRRLTLMFSQFLFLFIAYMVVDFLKIKWQTDILFL